VNDAADRADGFIEDQLHADRASQVINHVALAHQRADGGFVLDRVADEVEARLPAEGGQVALATGRKVVQHGHARAAVNEPRRQVRADKARAAGDQNFHELSQFIQERQDEIHHRPCAYRVSPTL